MHMAPVSLQSAPPADLKDANANFSAVAAPLTLVASSNHHPPVYLSLPLLSSHLISEKLFCWPPLC